MRPLLGSSFVLLSLLLVSSFSISAEEIGYPLPDAGEWAPVDVRARMIHYEPPHYPRTSRTARTGGTVWLRVLVGPEGLVKDAYVSFGCGHAVLDHEAREAAKACKFEPARRQGAPVEVWVTFKTEFTARRFFTGVTTDIPDIFCVPPAEILDRRERKQFQEAVDGLPIDRPAKIKTDIDPNYPYAALQTRVNGATWIKGLVGTDGKLTESELFAGSGVPAIDAAALEVATEHEFDPARRDGKKVPTWVVYREYFDSKTAFDKALRMMIHRWPAFIAVQDIPAVRTLIFPPLSPEPSAPIETEESVAIGRQDFGMLILHAREVTMPGHHWTNALIAGGVADGLEVGMEGAIWEETVSGPVKAADILVENVNAFQSMCRVTTLPDHTIALYHDVSFDIVPPLSTDLMARGMAYRDSSMYHQARACLERVVQNGDSSAFVLGLASQIRTACDKAENNPDEETLIQWRSRTEAHQAIAASYIRLGNRAQARKYLNRVLVSDPYNEEGLELREAITILDSCAAGVIMPSDPPDSTVVFDRPPEMDFYAIPTTMVESGPFNSVLYTITTDTTTSVGVNALVSSKGRVLQAGLARSSGIRAFDLAAVASAFKSRFRPGIVCGQPASAWVEWDIKYTTHSELMHQTASDTTALPQMDEFVPVEVIAEMIHYETPSYPRDAEQAGLQGLVWIKALVGRDGLVKDAVVYRTSGVPSLDLAAVSAAFGCKFKPAMQNNRPVAMWVTYKVEFILN